MLSLPIYLDNNATTPLDPRVLQEMMPFLQEHFGNPASTTHAYGWVAEEAVNLARERIALSIGANPEEIIFTSGATESDNLAILGMIRPGDHLIVSSVEHKAVLDPARFLQACGVEVTFLGVDQYGQVDPHDVEQAIKRNTKLISIMLANNEVGTINPIRDISEIAHTYNIVMHTDAAQALGKIPVSVQELGIDLMSLSAHKCYGPKGIGALYIRKSIRHKLQPIIRGGGHEKGLRSGTLNVPGIVGFGKAAEIASDNLLEEKLRLQRMRDLLWEKLSHSLTDIKMNGHPIYRLPNTLNVTFKGISASELLAELSGVAASSGSACTSAHPEPSHVLLAMGIEEEDAKSAIRFSLGRFNTEREIEEAAQQIILTVGRIKQYKKTA